VQKIYQDTQSSERAGPHSLRKIWSRIKETLRQAKARTIEALDQAIAKALPEKSTANPRAAICIVRVYWQAVASYLTEPGA
jgi:hypothetical protein